MTVFQCEEALEESLPTNSLTRLIFEMVDYAKNFHDHPDPPYVETRSTRFTHNIGLAVVKLMRQYVDLYDSEVLPVVTSLLSLPQERDIALFKDTVAPLTNMNRLLLESQFPFHHIEFLTIFCRLCVKLSEAGRRDLVNMCIAYILFITRELPNWARTFSDLDMYATRMIRRIESLQ